MAWSIQPYVGQSDQFLEHPFDVSNEEPQINSREQTIIDALEKALKEVVPQIGGFLSVSCYGSLAQIPSPGDTVALYVTYVADPAATGGIPAPAPAVSEEGMTTNQALAEQAQETATSQQTPGEQEGLDVSPVPSPEASQLPPEQPVAPSSGEDAQLVSEEDRLRQEAEQATQLAAQPPVPPAAPPVVTQQPAGQTQSLETGAGIGPDDAQARLAAQLAENPVQPKPLYWPDQGLTIDASMWPTADVLAANGAVLYNYAADQPGGTPTGNFPGWHVYEGQTQPAPGSPAAVAAAAGAPTA